MEKKVYRTWTLDKDGVPRLKEDLVRTNKVENLMVEVYGPDMEAKKGLGIG